MPRANSNGVLLVTMAGMAVVLCGGMVVMMEFAKTQIKKNEPTAPAKGPTGPYAEKIKDLRLEVYDVTQAGHDQMGYDGKYVRNSEPGLYLDAVSDEVLFSSLDKLTSDHGQAEFSKPFDPLHLVEKEEKAVDGGEVRLQVHSKLANSYLGWIAPDDPPGNRRYVINSNALRFVKPEDFEKNGLVAHRGLFPETPAAPAPQNGGAQ